ncbi:MAG: NRDE family protein, partial [Proteobacteria bacterium]|nr:NRDE family protein [Pseudomonadota bacterium]
MCTLIVMHRQVPGLPLVVAANRDDYLDRLSAPPALWDLSPSSPNRNPSL